MDPIATYHPGLGLLDLVSHIPQALRPLVRSSLLPIMQLILAHPIEVSYWSLLLFFRQWTLTLPSHGGLVGHCETAACVHHFLHRD